MLWAKQSTAFTVTVGPVLDSTGAEYTGLAVTDLKLRKHDDDEAALNASATLTATSNGRYTLVGTTSDTDTLGRLEIYCDKSTYQMPQKEFMVIPATVYDALVTNAANATGGLLAATAAVSAAAGYIGSTGAAVNGTNLAALIAKFTGITLIAEWLGLIAGKQTGNSTARTELRATGAGSGTFDETTDSMEAQADSALTAAQAFAAVLTTQMSESYAADGTAPTLAQAIFLIQQSLHEFAISGTTRTVKKLDGSTTAATFTLDSSTAPTSTTRSA